MSSSIAIPTVEDHADSGDDVDANDAPVPNPAMEEAIRNGNFRSEASSPRNRNETRRTDSKIICTLHNVPLSCIKIDELAQNGGTRQRPLSPDRETINCPDAEAKELPRDNELPASIYVQLDTCPGENHAPDAAVPEEPCPEAKESEPVPWYRRYNEVLR